MYCLAVDDEELALEQLLDVLGDVFEDKDIMAVGFDEWIDALEWVEHLKEENRQLEYAFLDIKMRGIRGIELAQKINAIFSRVKIVFVTGYKEYAYDAFQVYAVGYILKPVNKEAVIEVVETLDEKEKLKEIKKKRVRIQTFGNFDVFLEGTTVKFERTKAKELLAYLVDRKGAGVTTAEISAVLFDGNSYDKRVKNQTQKAIFFLMKALKEAGIERIVTKRWNYVALNIEEVDCDYYQYLRKDKTAVNTYMGEYMANYSWAEFTTAFLEEDKRNLRK